MHPLLPQIVADPDMSRGSKVDQFDGHGRDVADLEGFGRADGAHGQLRGGLHALGRGR
jgi:hypothetical protein